MAKRYKNGAFDYFNICIMILISFIMLYPFWYVLIVSLNDNSVMSYIKLSFLPKAVTFKNYEVIFTTHAIVNGFVISILRTVVGTTLAILANAALAFGLSNKTLMGRKYFLVLLTIPMFFGGGLIPSYMLWKALHLTNTFLLYFVPGIIAPFTVIVMKTYFSSTIPASIQESAKVEGANEIYIFLRLVLPMSTPMLAAFALFAAVGQWNDWATAEFFIKNRALHPLATVLRRLIFQQELVQNMSAMQQGQQGMLKPGKRDIIQAESVKMAAIMVTVLPIIMIYPFLQKYFIHGMMIGSIKE